MSYTITTTSGAVIATVTDGTINTSATSLTLIGKNYSGYGIFLNENYIQLLENFNNSIAPTAPLTGQLWYDNGNSTLKVYDGSNWKPISSSATGATQPVNPVVGDLWWDSANTQLKVWSGSSWVTIGPLSTPSSGTSGPAVETISDGASNHVAIKFYVQNTVVAIVSKDSAYTPNPSIAGFATIRPGLNLVTPDALTGSQFSGNATGASALISGSSLLTAGQFVRSDQNLDFGYRAKFQTNTGIYVGAGDNLQIDYSSSAVNLTGRTSNSDMNFFVNRGGVSTQAINIAGTSANVTVPANLAVTNNQTVGGRLTVSGVSTFTTANVSSGLNPTTDNTINIGSSSRKFNTIYVSSVVGTSFDGLFANVTNIDTTTLTAPALIKTGTDAVGNVGQASNRFNYVHAQFFSGTSVQAQYADLAERFAADAEYTPGTVVEIGGLKEITKVVQELSERVFGVISTKAAFLMNGGAGSDSTHPPVAVNGRVPVRVIGQVNKGDRLVSAGNGLARAATREEITAFNVIGRALENKTTDDEGLVEAIVKINS